jgi:hypothetical protein
VTSAVAHRPSLDLDQCTSRTGCAAHEQYADGG